MKTITAIATVLTIVASSAFGGGLKPAQVAGDANLVVHMDISAMLASGVGKFILAEAEKNADFVNKVTDLRQQFGFDLTRDLRGVTIYTRTIGDKSGVVLLDVTTDHSKVVELLNANDTHRESKYGKHTLHEWTDPAKTGPGGREIPAQTRYGAFYGDRMIVVASSMDLLKHGLDVLDGKAESLAKSNNLPMLPKAVKGEFMVGAAKDLPAPKKMDDDPGAAIFKGIRGISIQAGENDEGVFADAVATVGSAREAQQLRKVVQGFIALGQLMMAQRDDLPALNEQVTVNGTDTQVTVSASVPTDSLIEMLKFLRGKAGQRAARRQR